MSWILDKIYGIDEEEQRARELDAALAAENKRDLDAGVYTDATFKEAEANRIKSGGDGAGGDFEFSDDIEGAFVEGWNEGVDNVSGSIGSILALPFRLIPPIGWVLILVAAFFYFGGGVLLRRKITTA